MDNLIKRYGEEQITQTLQEFGVIAESLRELTDRQGRGLLRQPARPNALRNKLKTYLARSATQDGRVLPQESGRLRPKRSQRLVPTDEASPRYSRRAVTTELVPAGDLAYYVSGAMSGGVKFSRSADLPLPPSEKLFVSLMENLKDGNSRPYLTASQRARREWNEVADAYLDNVRTFAEGDGSGHAPYPKVNPAKLTEAYRRMTKGYEYGGGNALLDNILLAIQDNRLEALARQEADLVNDRRLEMLRRNISYLMSELFRPAPTGFRFSPEWQGRGVE